MAQNRKNFSIVLIIGVSLLIGFLGGYLAGFRYGLRLNRQNFIPPMAQKTQSRPSRTHLDAEAIEIIKELNCVCDCKMKLSPCTCEEVRGSKEIKAYVQELVEQRLLKSEVMERLVERYGQAVLIKRSS
ncbi:MAG: hypothetical protein GTO16_03455 [Candidatus Aminicenantes bacterium]|nr:hypothetical protein [Candidatus Aminicenantes bacterium]